MYPAHKKSAFAYKYLLLLILIYSIVWGILPAIFYSSIFPDSAQNIAWGNSLAWGYNEHPPLGAWFLHALLNVTGQHIELSVYLASVICFGISYIYVYKVSCQFLMANSALLATALSSLCYFSIASYALQYNQNIIMLPCWTALAYYFQQAITTNKIYHWLLLALVATLAILAKYQSAILILILFIYLLRYFKYNYVKYLLLSFTVTVILLLPHLFWLVNMDYLPIHYAFGRSGVMGDSNFWSDHVLNSLHCFLGMLLNMLLPIIIFYALFYSKKLIKNSTISVQQHHYYLFYLGLLPLIIVSLLSLSLGIDIPAEWGFPLFIFTLPAIFHYYQIGCNSQFVKKTVWVIGIVHFIIFITYTSVIFSGKVLLRTNNPSTTLANAAQSYWQKNSDNGDIFYVTGDVLGFYLATYLASHPKFIAEFSLKDSPWINQDSVRKKRVLLAKKGCSMQATLAEQHPNLIVFNQICLNLDVPNKFNTQTMPVMLAIVQFKPIVL